MFIILHYINNLDAFMLHMLLCVQHHLYCRFVYQRHRLESKIVSYLYCCSHKASVRILSPATSFLDDSWASTISECVSISVMTDICSLAIYFTNMLAIVIRIPPSCQAVNPRTRNIVCDVEACPGCKLIRSLHSGFSWSMRFSLNKVLSADGMPHQFYKALHRSMGC